MWIPNIFWPVASPRFSRRAPHWLEALGQSLELFWIWALELHRGRFFRIQSQKNKTRRRIFHGIRNLGRLGVAKVVWAHVLGVSVLLNCRGEFFLCGKKNRPAWSAPRSPVHPPRKNRNPRIHARGNLRNGKSFTPRSPRRIGRHHHPRQHLSSISAPRSRTHPQTGRPASLHVLGRRHSHRLRRLPGLQPFRASKDHRPGRNVSALIWTAPSICSRPKKPLEIQLALGSDIAMVLDECIETPAPRDKAEAALTRTTLWARRARESFSRQSKPHTSPTQQWQFGIVQGATFPDLRRESARQLLGLGFSWLRGRWLGRRRASRHDLRNGRRSHRLLPAERPRYLMGVGRPEQLADYVALGIDMMDCVLPTRAAGTPACTPAKVACS